MKLCVIILTRDEERHIGRALASVDSIATQIYVIDSGSRDKTRDIADAAGAIVLENPWINYSTQFNWALDQLPSDTDWVLRLDADEYLETTLAEEIKQRLPELADEVDGVYLPRRMAFMGKVIWNGGIFPVWMLRVFRYGRGRCENRWMDEHIIAHGPTERFGTGELIDDNHNSLTWWIAKHNSYASREVIDLLNLEYAFMPHETVANLGDGEQAGLKRWLKEKAYVRMPRGFRAFAYFLYRYVARLGFLDGTEGTAFHVLQGFWYRYLVDMKLHEVKKAMKHENLDAVSAIYNVLGIDIRK